MAKQEMHWEEHRKIIQVPEVTHQRQRVISHINTTHLGQRQNKTPGATVYPVFHFIIKK